MRRAIRTLLALAAILAAGASAFAGGTREHGASAAGGAALRIGLSFSDFATERWPLEAALLTRLGYDRGAQVISQVANHDERLQNEQIANMVSQGVNALIIVAENGDLAAQAAAAAHDAGVKVIAYDRLINTPKIDAYLSFDNVEVGRRQAQGVLKAKDSGNFVLLGGSPSDNNAILLRSGQMEVLKPLIDTGQVRVVADQWVENWDASGAEKIMDTILTAVHNKVDAVVASNDGTALGALRALDARGLAGTVPLSGQDASAAGCAAIVNGGLTVTVFKDVRKLSPMAIDLAIDLVRGVKSGPASRLKMYDLAALTLNRRLTGQVPCYFLPVVAVDQANVYDVVVKSGFQAYDDVYKDVPEDKRPPRP
jgi:D-xylose transport system substrate-binding protein